MRLILQFSDSDGFTYSCTQTHPVEYESGEALLQNLMDEALLALHGMRDFTLAGLSLTPEFFYERMSPESAASYPEPAKLVTVNQVSYFPVMPSIYTVDEWFATNAASSQ